MSFFAETKKSTARQRHIDCLGGTASIPPSRFLLMMQQKNAPSGEGCRVRSCCHRSTRPLRDIGAANVSTAQRRHSTHHATGPPHSDTTYIPNSARELVRTIKRHRPTAQQPGARLASAATDQAAEAKTDTTPIRIAGEEHWQRQCPHKSPSLSLLSILAGGRSSNQANRRPPQTPVVGGGGGLVAAAICVWGWCLCFVFRVVVCCGRCGVVLLAAALCAGRVAVRSCSLAKRSWGFGVAVSCGGPAAFCGGRCGGATEPPQRPLQT